MTMCKICNYKLCDYTAHPVLFAYLRYRSNIQYKVGTLKSCWQNFLESNHSEHWDGYYRTVYISLVTIPHISFYSVVTMIFGVGLLDMACVGLYGLCPLMNGCRIHVQGGHAWVAMWSHEWWLADGTDNLALVANDMGARILQIPPELHIWQR